MDKNKETMVQQAKKFVYQEFEFSKVKLPNLKDYKGRDSYKRFLIEVKEHTESVDRNLELYDKGVSTFGEFFVEQVEKERKEIGRKCFGFN